MFGSGGQDRPAVVAELRRKLADMGGGVSWAGSSPAALSGIGSSSSERSSAHDEVLAVPGPLAEVLPGGGIPAGSVVSLGSMAPGGGGATSLLLAMLAAPREAWAAAVGLPDLGLVAAAELGVDLARLALVPDPGPDIVQVLSVLADGVDVIASAMPGRLSPARQRVLTGKLRQHGTVLLVAGPWPGADVVLLVRRVLWSGLGNGYGRLRDRDVDVQVAGRRAGAAAGAMVTLRLRSTRTAVAVEQDPVQRPARHGAWTRRGVVAGGGHQQQRPAASTETLGAAM